MLRFRSRFNPLMAVSALALLATLGFATLGLVVSSKAMAEEHKLPTLRQIQHFELDPFVTPFKTNDVQIAPELVQKVAFELDQDKRLPKNSPAEGQLRLVCDKWPECNEVKLSVIYRPTGDELWSTSMKTHTLFLTWWFDSIPTNQDKIAKTLVNRLANAYRGF